MCLFLNYSLSLFLEWYPVYDIQLYIFFTNDYKFQFFLHFCRSTVWMTCSLRHPYLFACGRINRRRISIRVATGWFWRGNGNEWKVIVFPLRDCYVIIIFNPWWSRMNRGLGINCKNKLESNLDTIFWKNEFNKFNLCFWEFDVNSLEC